MSIEQVRTILDSALSLEGRAHRFEAGTPLLGHLPELDSMAVVTLLTSLEERFGILVEDDEVSAETFATLGTLAEFVDAKLTG